MYKYFLLFMSQSVRLYFPTTYILRLLLAPHLLLALTPRNKELEQTNVSSLFFLFCLQLDLKRERAAARETDPFASTFSPFIFYIFFVVVCFLFQLNLYIVWCVRLLLPSNGKPLKMAWHPRIYNSIVLHYNLTLSL